MLKTNSLQMTNNMVSNLKSIDKTITLENLKQGMNGVADTIANSLIVKNLVKFFSHLTLFTLSL